MGVEQSSQFSNTNPAGQSSSGKKTALVEVQWSSPFLTVRPAGPQIGQRESPIITDEVMPFFRQAGKTLKVLVLDLSDVTFMSSMGLGMCIAFRNQASAVGAKSVLFGVSAELLKLLAMMKIEKLYSIARNEDDLKTHLRD
jgi:anti-anti-sigma factor